MEHVNEIKRKEIDRKNYTDKNNREHEVVYSQLIFESEMAQRERLDEIKERLFTIFSATP